MKIDDLDYHLPDDLVAQEPVPRRDERLLVLKRKDGEIDHSRFYKLARHLNEGDLLILNDTRVMPARMFANKESRGRGARSSRARIPCRSMRSSASMARSRCRTTSIAR